MASVTKCNLVKGCRSDGTHSVRSLIDGSKYRACETHVSIARLHDDYAVLDTTAQETEE